MPTIDEIAYEVAGDWIQDNTNFELDGSEHKSLVKVILSIENNAIHALKTIKKYNHINNDLDAYLYEMAEWGIGIREIIPKREDYGIEL